MLSRSPHKEDIKAEIRKKHGTLAKFEEIRALPVGSVRDVLRGRAVSQTARAIAHELGMTTEELFPGRFKSHSADYSVMRQRSHRQSSAARA